MNISALVEPAVAAEVILLATILLGQPAAAAAAVSSSSSAVPVISYFDVSADAVIASLDGRLERSDAPVRLRTQCLNAAQLVQAPLVIEQNSNLGEFVTLLCKMIDRGSSFRVTRERSFTVHVGSPAEVQAFRENHALCSNPIPWTNSNTSLMWRLTKAEKLTVLLLLILTKSAQEELQIEKHRQINPCANVSASEAQGRPIAWTSTLHGDTPGGAILQSMRLVLYPFLRFICIGLDCHLTVSIGQLEKGILLPVPEDNCILSRWIGRVMDPLLSIDMVRWFHASKREKFATEKLGHYPPLDAIKLEDQHRRVILVILYMYFRTHRWYYYYCHKNDKTNSSINFDTNHALAPLAVQSFIAFIRIALHVRFSPGTVKEALPPNLQGSDQLFLELQVFLRTGSTKQCALLVSFCGFGGSRDTHLSHNRIGISMWQIARVVRERIDHQHKPLVPSIMAWERTPLKFLSASTVKRLADCCTLSTKDQITNEHMFGIVIEDVPSSHIQPILDGMKQGLEWNANDRGSNINHIIVSDLVHAMTNYQPMCLLMVRDPSIDLFAIRMHLEHYAICHGRFTADPQHILSNIGALLRGGPWLFHLAWARRVACRQLIEKRQKEQRQKELAAALNPKLQLDLDERDGDDDDAAAADGQGNNTCAAELIAASLPVCKANIIGNDMRSTVLQLDRFLPDLMDARFDSDNGQPDRCADLLNKIQWFMSERMVVSADGFWRLSRLHPDFFNTFSQKLAKNDQLGAWLMENKAEKLKDSESIVDDMYQDPISFVNLSDLARVEPLNGGEGLQAYTEIDHPELLSVMNAINFHLKKRSVKLAMLLLSHLKPVVPLTEQELKQYFPATMRKWSILKNMVPPFPAEWPTANAVNCNMRQADLGVQGACNSTLVTHQTFGPWVGFATFIFFHLEIKLPPKVNLDFLNALFDQRVFFPNRCGSELLCPIQEPNMYSSSLLPVSDSFLARQLCDDQRKAGMCAFVTEFTKLNSLIRDVQQTQHGSIPISGAKRPRCDGGSTISTVPNERSASYFTTAAAAAAAASSASTQSVSNCKRRNGTAVPHDGGNSPDITAPLYEDVNADIAPNDINFGEFERPDLLDVAHPRRRTTRQPAAAAAAAVTDPTMMQPGCSSSVEYSPMHPSIPGFSD